jgi:hypothetical protein
MIGNVEVPKPLEMTIIKKERTTSAVRTYSKVAVFSWGVSIIGKTIELYWPAMSTTLFNSLQAVYEGDVPVTFLPMLDDSSGSSSSSEVDYMVEVMSLDGQYHIKTNGVYRKEVRMSLLIISEVA